MLVIQSTAYALDEATGNDRFQAVSVMVESAANLRPSHLEPWGKARDWPDVVFLCKVLECHGYRQLSFRTKTGSEFTIRRATEREVELRQWQSQITTPTQNAPE